MDRLLQQKIDRQTSLNIRRAMKEMTKHPKYFKVWCDSLFYHVIEERGRLLGEDRVAQELYRAADRIAIKIASKKSS